METSAINELYGALEPDRHDSALNYDEDSVDIYSGLEDSPKAKGKSGKEQTFCSPQRLKDSMDLYEEFIAKEQVEKEATYSELKSKFDAAQNQVQELLSKVQQIETKNSSLNRENTLLKKNICALIKTAKMEIVRKDEEISKLSKRSNRGIFHISSLDRNQSSLEGRLGVGSRSVNKPDESAMVRNTPLSGGLTPRCTKGNAESTLKQHSSNSSSVSHPLDYRHAQSEPLSQSKDWVHTDSDLKQKDILEKSETNTDNNRSRSPSNNVQRCQDDDSALVQKSGCSRSLASQKHLALSSRSDTQSSIGPSLMDTETLSSSVDRSTKKKGTREHHRKEERRQEDINISEKSHIRNHGIKESEKKKIQGSEGRVKHNGSSSRENKNHSDHERWSAKEIDRDAKTTTVDPSRQTNEARGRSCVDASVVTRNASPVKTNQIKDLGTRTSRKVDEELSRNKKDQRSTKEQLPRSKVPNMRDDSKGAETSTKEQLLKSKEYSGRDDSRGAQSSTAEQSFRCRVSNISDDLKAAQSSTDEQLLKNTASSSHDDSKGAPTSTEEQLLKSNASRIRDCSRGAQSSTKEQSSRRKLSNICDDSKGAQTSIEEQLLKSKASSSRDNSRGAQSFTKEQSSRSKASSNRDDFRGGQRSSEGQLIKSKASSNCESSKRDKCITEEQLPRGKPSGGRDGSRSGQRSSEHKLSRNKTSSSHEGSRSSSTEEVVYGRDESRLSKSSTQEDLSRRKATNSSRHERSSTDEPLPRSKDSSSRDSSRNGKRSSQEQLSKSKVSSIREGSRGVESITARPCHLSADKDAATRAEKGRSKSDNDSKKPVRSLPSVKSKPDKDSLNGISQTARQSTKRKSSVTLPSSSDTPKEGSPNRKLSFMETLNLTLSPIKNPNLVFMLEESGKPERAFVTNSEDEASFALGEEFCILDKAENTQEFTEAMEDCLVTTTSALPLDPSNSSSNCSQGHDVPTGSTESPICPHKNVKERELEALNRLEGDLSTEAKTSDKKCMDSEVQEIQFITEVNNDELATSVPPTLHQSVAEIPSPGDSDRPVNRPAPQEQDHCLLKNQTQEQITNSLKLSTETGVDNKPELISVQSGPFKPEVTSIEVNATSMTCSGLDTFSLEVVSSTVGVNEVSSQNKAACADIQTKMNMNLSSGLEKPIESSAMSLEHTIIGDDATPSHQTGPSEPDSTEDETNNFKPSSSVVSNHDEDSMMLTLRNIKVIPEAISPITSPVRQINRVQQQRSVKEQHIKSLSKDFSTSAMDKVTVQMDMNKENKRPDLPVTSSTLNDQQEPLTSSATQDSLEEGEIVSESDEDGALVIQSRPVRKRSSPKLQPSLKSPSLKTVVTPNHCKQGKNTTPTSSDSPTTSKRRFKTVTTPSKMTVSSSGEFINTFSYIRSELRRKYMKLHRNVTKTAFCAIVDMSLASFKEFVDSVNFHKFCASEKEIKSKLHKIITNVMSKVSNNGIVNRIFEQRADDLKQKLWAFVDGQFDFLFKEVKAALKCVSDHSRKTTLNSKETEAVKTSICKIQSEEPLSVADNVPLTCQTTTLPVRARGLGSSGKNIKATMDDGSKLADEQPPILPAVVSSLEKPVQETVPVQEPVSTLVRRLSQNASIQDRSDFEILTEQQASSLTFNLVTDSQMGDIFRCLLQGSDLLEAGVSVSDHQNWQLNTPRKDGMSTESLMGVMTPSKLVTPFKLGMTWPPISPYKFASPNSKFQMPINPALLDESCMLEVPSNALPNQTVSTLSSVKAYSVLAEDLAVSLTIPSPLKSEDHLSFLNPQNVQIRSTPSSVISAHYSEDALLDEEDATVQDIHLALDTDNSSCSSTGEAWEAQNSAIFQVKPNLPMQAEVMERSNDHFIVRIRHTEVPEKIVLEQNEALLEAQSKDKTLAFPSDAQPMDDQPLATSVCQSEAHVPVMGTLFNTDNPAISLKTCENQLVQATLNPDAGVDTASLDPPASLASADPKNPSADDVLDSLPKCDQKNRKRKKPQSGSRGKRSRRERSQGGSQERQKHRSKSSKEKSHKSQKSPSPQLSPNSLSAKNIIRKKGEVVVTWTREEDRDILVELKLKGLSSKTFAALSSKLRKSQGQIEERVNQLMKLLKKKEKMES